MGIKSSFWKPHLAGWRGSGLRQTAYCRRYNLSPPSSAANRVSI